MNIPIRLTYTVVPSNDSISTRELLGRITELNYDERDGGFLVFEHIFEEAARLFENPMVLNLGSAIIWGVGILSENFDTVHYLDCPRCNGSIAIGVAGVQATEEIKEKEG